MLHYHLQPHVVFSIRHQSCLREMMIWSCGWGEEWKRSAQNNGRGKQDAIKTIKTANVPDPCTIEVTG